MDTIGTNTYLRDFASVLTYPAASLPARASTCASAINVVSPRAAALMTSFADHVADTPLSTLEEEYTSVFDLDPKCALYVGYHLFGESYKRSVFLLGLNERFGAAAFTPPGELPDHLPVVLQCLAAEGDPALAQELISDAVIPALDRMTGRVRSNQHGDTPHHDTPDEIDLARRAPYMAVLEALRLVLGAPDSPPPEDASVSAEMAGATRS